MRQAVEEVIISHNKFDDVGISEQEVSRDAVDSYWSGRELILSNNLISKTGCMGFDIKGAEPQGKYQTGQVVIANNFIKETRYSAILLSSAGVPAKARARLVGSMVVQGNFISACNRKNQSENDAAIWVHHGLYRTQINNNHIDTHRGHGIALTNFFKGALGLQSLQVNSNMIYGCRYQGKAAGLYVHQITGLQMNSNMVEDCDQVLQFDRLTDKKALQDSLQVEGNHFSFGLGSSLAPDWMSFLQADNKLVGLK